MKFRQKVVCGLFLTALAGMAVVAGLSSVSAQGYVDRDLAWAPLAEQRAADDASAYQSEQIYHYAHPVDIEAGPVWLAGSIEGATIYGDCVLQIFVVGPDGLLRERSIRLNDPVTGEVHHHAPIDISPLFQIGRHHVAITLKKDSDAPFRGASAFGLVSRKRGSQTSVVAPEAAPTRPAETPTPGAKPAQQSAVWTLFTGGLVVAGVVSVILLVRREINPNPRLEGQVDIADSVARQTIEGVDLKKFRCPPVITIDPLAVTDQDNPAGRVVAKFVSTSDGRVALVTVDRKQRSGMSHLFSSGDHIIINNRIKVHYVNGTSSPSRQARASAIAGEPSA
jgi:hypothetical protein